MKIFWQALERHVPAAKEILRGVSMLPRETVHWEGGDADFLVAFGVNFSLYALARSWLDSSPKRRLAFIEDRPEALARLLKERDAISLLGDLRVKIYFLETPLQIEPVAKRLAWSAVFLKMEVLDLAQSKWFPLFQKALERCHLGAQLLLSDAADGGCSLIRNARGHRLRPLRSALDLKGVFSGIPAILVGAGPSLEKNGHLLSALRDRALILAGGSALSLLNFAPHFGVAIDKDVPLKKRKFHEDVPICFQARAHPDSVWGESLLVPDAHFPFLNWLFGQKELFDGGWTVGTLLAALAVHWGCNPIVFVGMDFSYKKGQKYAYTAAQSEAKEGQPSDWCMAVHWLEELARKESDRRFINATEGGKGFAPPILSQKLKEVPFTPPCDLKAQVAQALSRLSFSSIADRWKEWEESLRNCAFLSKCALKKKKVSWEGEVAYEQLLAPLWTVWKSIFEREVELDIYPLSREEKMGFHQALFFQQMVEEHLAVLREETALHYSSGALYAKNHFLNGKREGKQEAFYPNGQLKTREEFREGRREGEVVLYWPNGALKRRCFFQNGIRSEPDQFWNEKGELF